MTSLPFLTVRPEVEKDCEPRKATEVSIWLKPNSMDAAVLIVPSLIGHNHAAVVQILGSTPVAIVMLLFIISGAYHMRLGMQVIIEDYVHDEGAKYALLIANTFFSVLVGFSSVYAILKLSFGV